MRLGAGLLPAWWRPVVAALLLALLGGCSLIGVAYEHADQWLLRAVDDYVSLRPAQHDRLRLALRARLEQHRMQELPDYIDFLDSARAAAIDGLTAAEVESLLSRLQGLAAELVRGTLPPVAAVLAELDEVQRARLAERLRAGNRDYEEDYVQPATAKRLAKRAKATGKQLAHWIGDLTPAQRERVSELTRAWPDFAARWHAYRVSRVDGLMALLQRHTGAAEIEGYLASRWVRHAGQSADLERDVTATRSGIVGLVVALDVSLTVAQRKALLDRLRAYRADLTALLPHGAPAVAAAGLPEAAGAD